MLGQPRTPWAHTAATLKPPKGACTVVQGGGLPRPQKPAVGFGLTGSFPKTGLSQMACVVVGKGRGSHCYLAHCHMPIPKATSHLPHPQVMFSPPLEGRRQLLE